MNNSILHEALVTVIKAYLDAAETGSAITHVCLSMHAPFLDSETAPLLVSGTNNTEILSAAAAEVDSRGLALHWDRTQSTKWSAAEGGKFYTIEIVCSAKWLDPNSAQKLVDSLQLYS